MSTPPSSASGSASAAVAAPGDPAGGPAFDPALDRYRSPLAGRYASDEMQRIWSPRRRFGLWRRLWLALAEAQRELGLPITEEQVAELRAHLDDIDLDRAAEHEARLRHDVMAHVHALRDVAPAAGPIIHLGATSQFVGCNGELLQMHEALDLACRKTAAAVLALADFADRTKDMPALGFTHYQPAQPTTTGKRAALWAHDLALALEDLEHRRDGLRLRGAKGTTGTQASFLALFDGDEAKVDALDRLVVRKLGWPEDRRFLLTGQTYPRIVDAQVLGSLAVTAAALAKCATDIRLLAGRRELAEPFGRDQIGSSAMPYKRNPMRCERICGMCRHVTVLAAAPLQTASTQWLERTLDDSSNRRMVLPEAFLALDGALDLMVNVASGLQANEAVIRANLLAELPFMATENVLMAAVRAGGDRQELHEAIRRHSHEAARRIVEEGAENDLLERLAADPAFAAVDLSAVLDPAAYVGRAPRQVETFLDEIAGPIRDRYRNLPTSREPSV